jgi:hypothetical protein
MKGLTTLIKSRPIDVLLKLINETKTSDVKNYMEFFEE